MNAFVIRAGNFWDGISEKPIGQREILVIGERNPVLIAVPPQVYHGWMSLEDDTQLIGISSHTYNREDPDEIRVPPDHFGDLWTVKGW